MTQVARFNKEQYHLNFIDLKSIISSIAICEVSDTLIRNSEERMFDDR